MNFDVTLKKLVEDTDGAVAAVLMGMDGISVSEVRKEDPGFPLQDVLVEYGQILSEAVKIAQAHGLGTVEEIMVASNRFRIVIRILNATYFVSLVLKMDSNIGRGRFLLRRSSEIILSEL